MCKTPGKLEALLELVRLKINPASAGARQTCGKIRGTGTNSTERLDFFSFVIMAVTVGEILNIFNCSLTAENVAHANHQ